jgi:polyribonucleotide nucleotidyltransferase
MCPGSPLASSATTTDLSCHLCADIPATRVVAGVRIGLLEGEGFVVNPTVQQMEASSLDLLLAGSASAVLMIEGFADFLPEEQLLEVCEL